MGFDSPDLVRRYAEERTYPAIHQALFDFARDRMPGEGTILDLCSSTGLLGRHFADQGRKVVAVEASAAAVARGARAGIYGDDLPVLHMRIDRWTSPRLVSFMRSHEVRIVLARRCLYHLVDLPELGTMFALGGATELFAQGLVRTQGMVHATLDGEIAALDGWREADRMKPELAWLRHAPVDTIVLT